MVNSLPGTLGGEGYLLGIASLYHAGYVHPGIYAGYTTPGTPPSRHTQLPYRLRGTAVTG